MTNEELVSTLFTAAESTVGNIALTMLLITAAERIRELSENISE
jgi:hypothetical protein